MRPTTKPCLIRTAPHDHDYNQNKCGLPERYTARPWLPTAQLDPRKWPKNFALAIDTECTGLDPFHPLTGMDGEQFLHAARPFLVCATDGVNDYCWRGVVNPNTREVKWKAADIREMRKVFASYRWLVLHHAAFDARMLDMIGVPEVLQALLEDRVHDTLGGSHVLDSDEPHGLKSLAARYLNFPDADESVLRQRVLDARNAAKQMGIPRGPDVGCDYFLPHLIWKTTEDQDYCLKDCYRSLLLWVFQQRELERQGLLDMYCREMRVLRDTLRIQRRGVRILEDRSEKMHEDLEARAAKHETEVVNRASRLGHRDFNPRSHVQLKTLCFDTLTLPILQLTEKKQPSTNADVIEQLGIMTTDMAETGRIRRAYAAFGMTPARLTTTLQAWYRTAAELFHHLEHYRSSNTRRNYTRGYLRSRQWHDTEDRDGYYVFTNLNPWGTATTRFSSSDENLQNIDKELLRLMFGPPPGWQWISADFDQLEIRLMCRTSLDPTLNRILRDGLDRHQMTADLFGVPRALGKAVNFAWQYGAGAPKLGKMLGVSAAEFVEQMRKLHPGIIDHQNEIMALVRSRYKQYGLGFVYTLFGYRLTVPISSPYVGINYEVQGSAGDILKYAVTACMDYIDTEGLQDDIRIILTVHDEILFECRTNFPKKHLRRLREIMSATGDPVGCPTPADMKFTTTSWGELKELVL